jgi:hypothetical protein
MRIIETDNFCGDYPNEKFLNIASYRTSLLSPCRAGRRTPFPWRPRPALLKSKRTDMYNKNAITIIEGVAA